MTKRTRLKSTLAMVIFLAMLTLMSTIMRLETIAVSSIGSMMTVLTVYLWAETKRPSARVKKSYGLANRRLKRNE